MAPTREDNTEAVAREVAELAEATDVGELWDSTVELFGDYLHEGVDLDPWPGLANRIERSLEEGRAASYLRLCDGEGNVLGAALAERPALADRCLRHMSARQLGAPDALPRAAPQLLPAYAEAVRNADVIGFPGPFSTAVMLERWEDERYWPPIQGLVTVQRYLIERADELGLAATTGAASSFNRGLLPHYERLISGRRIGVISCRPGLADALRSGMQAEEVDVRAIPGEARFAGDSTAPTGHWPERYGELLEELRELEPGTLWLVAAGVLGKVYCEAIRAAGAVALDVGHAADIWVGMQTRFTTEDELLDRWRLV